MKSQASIRRAIALIACLSLAPFVLAQEKKDDAKKDEKKWDVNAPGGPTQDVDIDTDEGTWLSLDLSPDGKELAFDLLGDIYTLPIGGGEAKAIATGVAWEMQPRYSPDGKRIAFTSDAGGGDNIWTMDRDGGNKKQVTKESFRLLNSPAWSPDGQFIAARKHFSSHRSIGSGEIWLYHTTGGDGLQMTTKPNEQKDVGEPAFSPDGRYVYWSFDSSPGETFEYSKDPNKQIYAINRLDRTTGEITNVVSGPGGACRPTPSPDGKSLAFVRRIRYQTTLFVMDLKSGEVRPVFDGLERDMQETWAIHGVYPNMAWTPDARSIVLWAKGKFQRVDVSNGKAEIIPFHVKGKRTIVKALRSSYEAAPDEFQIKALRWVRVSPSGDRVAYQTLGHIWIRDLPNGTPKRLTNDAKHFEFMPSFSRDGKSIVYTTWNDTELGAIAIAPAAGGDGKAITTEPGHFVDPVFSPDGSKIVFGKVSGGGLTSPIWSHDPGVYWMPSSGGEMKLVTKSGTNPQFGADNERVFLTTQEEKKDKDQTSLFSIDLSGANQRTNLTSENATEFALSTDGKWVAWVERFNAYIAPFVPTGRAVDLGPKSTAVPVARVSKDAGENVQFSGDASELHWSLGPELFTRKLSDSFAFLAGAPEKLPDVPTAGLDIAFRTKEDKPSGSLAFTHARIISMKGDEVIDDGTIVVQSNRIQAIGKASAVSIPADAKIFDASGTTIMPGIVDVHAHGPQAENGVIPERNWASYANLAFGVTTIHDPSHDTNSIFAASEMQKAGLIVAPRTFSTGTILYGAMGTEKAEIDSLDDARSHLRRLKAVGAFSVKSYNQPRREQRQEIIAAARELDMLVVPEGGSLFEHNMTMVVDGHTGVEHSLPVASIYKDVSQLWGKSGVGYTPTLIVGYGGSWGENYWYDTTDVWKNERLTTFVPRNIVDPRSRRRIKAPLEEYNTFTSSKICKALVDAGADVHLGAHGQLAGLGAHWELWLIAQSGLTPLQCLRAATYDGARYIGMDRDIGSLEAGKLADFLVLDKNPLESIQNSESIRYTVLNGRVYDARTMARVAGGDPTPPAKFFWSKLQDAEPGHLEDTACHGCGLVDANEVVDGYH